MTPEERAAYMRKYRQENAARISSQRRGYRTAHKADISARRHRERHNLDLNKERAVKLNLGITAGTVPLGLALDLAIAVGPFPCTVVSACERR